jgi:crotonobetainyl-CoA:carnitine CoA-transferase CaiB-like acyl-CoA transferase
MKLSATPAEATLPPPMLGQHTDEVLREVLNYSEAQLLALKAATVI